MAVNAKATGVNSYASGYGASGTGAVALGNNASATGSIASEANTVSFGSPGAERRLTNVAAGINGTDAVNVDQLQVVRDGVRQAQGGVAAAMALGGTMIAPDSIFSLSFNASTFAGQQGFAGSAVARVNEHVYLSGGVAGSTARNSTGGRVGVTFGF